MGHGAHWPGTAGRAIDRGSDHTCPRGRRPAVLSEPSHRKPAILSGLTGLRIDGGIASVARCVARAFDHVAANGGLRREDRVLLLEDPGNAFPPPVRGDRRLAHGSQLRFVWEILALHARHCHDLTFFDQLGLARSMLLPLGPLSPRRYAVFVHGIELDRAISGPRRRVLRGAWRLVANSPFTAERLSRTLPEVADRVRLALLCIDPERTDAWARLADGGVAPDRQRAVLIVGRMWSEEPGKGHEALIACWPRVVSRFPEAELWVVGAGDDRPRLESLARSADRNASIRFLGRVDDAELSRLYRTASVFAMPSQQEGFGLVYAEAMWHGLPCIGSRSDAAVSVIRDQETGLLVPFGDVDALGDAILGLLGDEPRRAAMGKRAREEALTRFGYERFRDDLLDALELPRP